jgi:archaemetzincin
MKLFFCILTSFNISIGAAQLTIAIQPFENVDTNQLLPLLQLISKEYNNAAIKILSPLPLPQSAFYKPRNRYRAEKLLEFLDSLNNGNYDRVVGFTKKDISTTKDEYDDWGIFGLGNLNGYSCVVSTFRLKKDGNSNKYSDRLLKIIIHELGHTFGLYHCDWRYCIMTDYKGSIQPLDIQWFHLCAPCRQYFRKHFVLE